MLCITSINSMLFFVSASFIVCKYMYYCDCCGDCRGLPYITNLSLCISICLKTSSNFNPIQKLWQKEFLQVHLGICQKRCTQEDRGLKSKDYHGTIIQFSPPLIKLSLLSMSYLKIGYGESRSKETVSVKILVIE